MARPRFYDLSTADGVSYEKIARLHAADVLATTVVQTCSRYDEAERCRFCAIEESLRQGTTVAVKTPAMLAEVARAAVDLDGVRQMVMTTGTSTGRDRGATHLARCVRAVRDAVPGLPIQVQLEPPGDLASIRELHDAGAGSIGIHVESLDDQVRRRWMPGKGSVPMSDYRAAWAEAVRVFGWNQVSTYVLVGLGEDPDELVRGCEELISMGVYPFVVPYRPLAGTLAKEVDGVPAPSRDVVHDVTSRVAAALRRAGMWGTDQAAGCAACGACSALGSACGDREGGVVTGLLEEVVLLGGPRRAAAGTGLTVTVAESPADLAAYHRLRREVFVDEQHLFEGSDHDAVDDDPRTRVLLARAPGGEVLGGVRIHPMTGPDLGWWRGSRLVVGRGARMLMGVGATLVRAACAAAEQAGALRFDATVQARNERMFTRLGWVPRERIVLHDAEHVLVEWPVGRVQRLVDRTKAVLGPLVGSLLPHHDGFLGDDGAPVPGTDVVAACDAVLPSMVERDPEWAGWCAVLVNVNDLVAMGATPVGLLDALGARDASFARRVLQGLRSASEAFDVPVLGGHTQLGVPASLTVTAVGRAESPVPGGGGTPGEVVRVTADLGGSWRPGYSAAQVGLLHPALARRAAATPRRRAGAAADGRQGRLDERPPGHHRDTRGGLGVRCGARRGVRAATHRRRRRRLADVLPGVRPRHDRTGRPGSGTARTGLPHHRRVRRAGPRSRGPPPLARRQAHRGGVRGRHRSRSGGKDLGMTGSAVAAVAARFDRDLDTALASVAEHVHHARARGVGLLALPEAALGGYLSTLGSGRDGRHGDEPDSLPR
ncbi:MSMEG_0568 family radical SAM protein [Nocardioides sp. TF02-7]|nr:MSMEG_0568 family radical SAM protein [Nocardioides sp. TF02-7]UMG93010.1 MSMEG_0568 family radical SAM protein [Nocardioides sp. TF02-7]